MVEIESKPYHYNKCRMFRHSLEKFFIAHPKLREARKDKGKINEERYVLAKNNFSRKNEICLEMRKRLE